MEKDTCLSCGGRKRIDAAVCHRCRDRARAAAPSFNWRGGRTIASNGYALVYRPDHPLADRRGYVYEHRIVASERLGRALRKGEQVHHRNGIKTDNRPENLVVTASQAAHQVHHRSTHRTLRLPGEANPVIACSCGCGGTLPKFDAQGRSRRFITGHNTRRVI